MARKKLTDEEFDKEQFGLIHMYVDSALESIRRLRCDYLFIKQVNDSLEIAEKLIK